VSLLAHGDPVAQRGLCSEPFTSPAPCPIRGNVRFTDLQPNSVLRVDVVDAAGNHGVAESPVEGLPRDDVNEPPSVAPKPSIVGALRLIGLRTLRVRYSAPPVIKGTVKAGDGSPLGGVVVRSSDGTSAKTDAKGRFSVRLKRGVSREVRITYGQSLETVKVIVAAPIRFTSNRTRTRNGRSITFDGSVPGSGKARTRVELQALAHGKWVPFKTAELRNGRFRATYRFTRTFVAQRYSFRAVIRTDDDFPYAAGKSAVVKVLVRA
jgi:hypothetical protein